VAKAKSFYDWHEYAAVEAPCSACGKASVLVCSQDRFFHFDGSQNDLCWRKIMRNETILTVVLHADKDGLPYITVIRKGKSEVTT
jgi:hypothetical protein